MPSASQAVSSLVRPQRGPTLADQVYDTLREAIAERQLAPGEPLAEPRLAGELGVSRTPVREALARLADAGLVSIDERGTAWVTRSSPQALAEAFEVREALEGMSAQLAASRRTDEEASVILACAKRSQSAAERADPADFRRADVEFHAAIAVAAHNTHLETAIERAGTRARALRQLDYPGQAFFQACAGAHQMIAQAILNHDPAAAESAMRQHICLALAHVTAAHSSTETRAQRV